MFVSAKLTEVTQEVAKAAPAVTVSSLTMFGVPLQSWVFILTIVYTVLQISFLLYDRLFKRNTRDRYRR